MVDTLTEEQRSHCMSRIRSKWTKQEKTIHNYLKSRKIKHKMHPKIKGNPDILFIKTKTVVFLHGCFWHKCPKCYIKPKSNKAYWLPKIDKNVLRDKENEKLLKSQNYHVIKIWEHEIKKEFDSVLGRLYKYGTK